jgi:hypothetical protein
VRPAKLAESKYSRQWIRRSPEKVSTPATGADTIMLPSRRRSRSMRSV